MTHLLFAALFATAAAVPDNPAIDMDGYLSVAREAAAWRQSHRVSEEEFIRMSGEPGTIVLDARNFRNAEGPFPGKAARAALNISTFIALYGYGYRNVYELAPLLDIHATKLDLQPSTGIR